MKKETDKIEKILVAVGKRPQTDEEARETVVIFSKHIYLLEEVPYDLNAIRELELLVIEKVGAERYGDALCDCIGWEDGQRMYEWYSYLATADAPTRIAVMIAALEGE